MGYCRIRDELDRHHGIRVNAKRVLRICRAPGIQPTIKFRRHGCNRRAAASQYVAKNYLGRHFHADAPNLKWLTDVTDSIRVHSDRGFQYTSAAFHKKVQAAGMKQSMSRVAHCLDNGTIEGFWGILFHCPIDGWHIK